MAEYTGGSVTTYYVSGGDALASDSNAGTETTVTGRGAGPWETIQKAFDKIADGTIVDGDEVRIMASKVYHIGVPLTATWDTKEIIITGATSAASGLVDGTVVEINGNTAAMDGVTMMHGSVGTLDHTMFANLYFNAADNASTCVQQSTTASHYVNWINCRFSSAKDDGVMIASSNYWSFINCRFDNNAAVGLHIEGSHFGMIYKCLFDNNSDRGCRLQGAARVVENVFYGNSGDGLYTSNSAAVVVNNIFDSNYDYGYKSEGSGQSVHVGNIYSNNGLDGSGSGIAVGSNAEARHFNSLFYGNDDGWGYTTGTDHLCLYNSITAGTDPAFLQPAGPTFDFTPTATFNGLGAGLPTPFAWYGSTADDIGLNKWKSSESISIF